MVSIFLLLIFSHGNLQIKFVTHQSKAFDFLLIVMDTGSWGFKLRDHTRTFNSLALINHLPLFIINYSGKWLIRAKELHVLVWSRDLNPQLPCTASLWPLVF